MKQKIRKWLRKKGYKLEASNYDQYDPDEKTIYYNKRLSKKNKLYTILHECGHLLVQQNIFSWITLTLFDVIYMSFAINEWLYDATHHRMVTITTKYFREQILENYK